MKIEGPVLRIGQLVVDVIAAEQERTEQISGREVARFGLCEVRKQRLKRGRAACAGGGGSRGSERDSGRLRPFCAKTGETKGGASVTPNGPLKPPPALGEN